MTRDDNMDSKQSSLCHVSFTFWSCLVQGAITVVVSNVLPAVFKNLPRMFYWYSNLIYTANIFTLQQFHFNYCTVKSSGANEDEIKLHNTSKTTRIRKENITAVKVISSRIFAKYETVYMATELKRKNQIKTKRFFDTNF